MGPACLPSGRAKLLRPRLPGYAGGTNVPVVLPRSHRGQGGELHVLGQGRVPAVEGRPFRAAGTIRFFGPMAQPLFYRVSFTPLDPAAVGPRSHQYSSGMLRQGRGTAQEEGGHAAIQLLQLHRLRQRL